MVIFLHYIKKSQFLRVSFKEFGFYLTGNLLKSGQNEDFRYEFRKITYPFHHFEIIMIKIIGYDLISLEPKPNTKPSKSLVYFWRP